MSHFEQTKAALIACVDVYNHGLSNCDTDGGLSYGLLYAAILAVLVVFQPKNVSFASHVHNFGISILMAFLYTIVILNVTSWNDSATMIYMNPSGAIRYGCYYHSAPIRLNPIFDDPQLFERIYKDAKGIGRQSIEDAIAVLRALSIEYNVKGV